MTKTLLYGNEPFLMDEYKKKVQSERGKDSCEIKTSYEFGSSEYDFVTMNSFFHQYKILFLHLETLVLSKDLKEALEMDPDDVALYVFWNGPIARNKKNNLFLKIFDKKIIYNKVSDKELRERIVVHIENHCSYGITTKGFELLCRKINYSSPQVNLFNVYNALNVICYLDTQLTEELIEEIVPDNEQENVYKIIRFIMEQKFEDLFRYCRLIDQNRESKEIIGVLSLLCFPFRSRILMATTGAKKDDLKINSQSYIPSVEPQTAQQCISYLLEGIRNIKRGLDAGEELKVCLIHICGQIHGKKR